jgi:hypothetical protein
MMHRNRKLLDIAHDAPCFLNLASDCGKDKSVPCHSDMLRHGRGVGHKTHDCYAIPGCPACHNLFTREHLGGDSYGAVWAESFENYVLWLWQNDKIGVK